MNNIETEIRTIVETNKKSYAKMLKCRKEMYDYIMSHTSFLSNVQLSTRLYYLFNHIESRLRCSECGVELNTEFVALSPYDPDYIHCKNCSTKVAKRRLLIEIENDHTVFDEFESSRIESEMREGLKLNSSQFRKGCWSKDRSYVLKYLNFKYPHLRDGGYDWDTKFYWFYHNLTEFPKCVICGKLMDKNVFSFTAGYPTACSDCKIEMMHRRNFELYGTIDPGNSKWGREKSRKTRLERYGDANYTNREKYKDTCQKKFGGNAPACSKEVQKKMKQTTLERYGVENVFCGESSIRKQFTDELQRKYGVSNFMQLPEMGDRIGRIEKTEFYNSLTNTLVEPLFSLDEYCSLTTEERHNNEFNWKCRKCGNSFSSRMIYDGGIEIDGIITHAYCPECYKELDTIQSMPQKKLVEYIESIYSGMVKENDRTVLYPKELDIYIPEKHLAIEYDGLYWHCEASGKKRCSHLNKTINCESQDIHLIHIFENEWLYKQEIVKSRIRNLLGIYDKTIYARKCVVKEIDSKTSIDFQEQNHIQGSVKSKVNLGLYCDDELVSIMTFSSPRFNKNIEWELVRFCSRIGYHVVGAAGKLLACFERQYRPKNLISYADRRWSMGNLYKELGFNLDRESPPNYWYFKRGNLESRVKYQKHKLKNLLEKYDESKSEVQNMKDNGYDRIFDCGNLVFIKSYEH